MEFLDLFFLKTKGTHKTVTANIHEDIFVFKTKKIKSLFYSNSHFVSQRRVTKTKLKEQKQKLNKN